MAWTQSFFFRKSLQIRMNFQKRHPVGGENEERDALRARRIEAPACGRGNRLSTWSKWGVGEAPACGRTNPLWAGAFTRDSAIRFRLLRAHRPAAVVARKALGLTRRGGRWAVNNEQ